MLKVGLTGGLACGKTFVGEALASMGCHLIQADHLGHEVLAPGGEAFDAVVRDFGREVLDADGAIDRRKLAQEVFYDPKRLATLTALVHPPVFAREERLLAEAERADPQGIAVVEAAILIETGSYKRYDRVLLVTCEEEIQIRRAMKRDGATREQVLARLKRQMPLEAKQKFADYVIDTSGTKEETLLKVREIYASLRRIEK